MAEASGEKLHLIESLRGNEEFSPVDRAGARPRYRRVLLGVVGACCLGLGLSLAIALPLVNRSSGDSGATGGADEAHADFVEQQGQNRLLTNRQYQEEPAVWNTTDRPTENRTHRLF